MKKLKKLLTLICVGTLVAIIALLTACGGTTPTPDNGGTPGGENPGGENPGGENPGGENPPVATVTVTLNPTTLTLEEGQTGEFTVTVTGSETAPTVTSSKPATATAALSNDKKKVTVTAVAAGTADITVSVGDKSAKCAVTVTAAPVVDDSLDLYYGENVATYVMLEDNYVENDDTDDLTTMELEVKYGGEETVTATTGEATVATAAYADGKVTLTAVGTGKTTLTVTAGDKTKTCTVEVGTFGLVYGLVEGEDSDYMEVSGSERLTSANVYIPGYAYYEDYDEYFPVTRMKNPTKNGNGGDNEDGAFQPVEPAEGEERLDPIVTVYTGDNVNVIAPGAFRKNYKLQSVKLGPLVTVIDRYAFDNCTSLTTIEWSPVIKTINRVAFANCGFEEIETPVTLDFIGDGAFTGCANLKKAKINGPVKMLYGGTFQQCLKLEEVWLPAELETIANLAFYMPDVDNGWAEIPVTYPSTLHFAGKRDAWEALYNAQKNDANTFLNKNDTLVVICADDADPKLFIDKTESDTNVHAGPITITATTKNLDGVEVTATSSNTAVGTVEVNDKVITVTPVAVGTTTITVSCGNLTATCEVAFNELKLEDTANVMVGVGDTLVLQVNGDSAAVASESIATAEYADGLVTITGKANGKTTLTVGEDTCTIWVGTTGLTYETSEDGTYLILTGSSKQVDNLYVPGYATIDNVNYLPIKEIAAGAFKDAKDSKFVSVFTGDNVVTIRSNAFHNNNDEKFTTIKMGAALKVVEERAFDDIENTQMTLDWGESQPTTIGNEAFAYCQFETVVVPRSVTSLGDKAFGFNDSLKVIKILCDNLQNIPQFAFSRKMTLDESEKMTVYISKGVKSIAYNAFRAGWVNENCKNAEIYYEGSETEYATLIATANNNSEKYGYDMLNPGSSGGINVTVHYEVDFTNL